MKYNVSTIEEYLELIPFERKEIVLRLIAITKEYFPEIKGNMEYNMPTLSRFVQLHPKNIIFRSIFIMLIWLKNTARI